MPADIVKDIILGLFALCGSVLSVLALYRYRRDKLAAETRKTDAETEQIAVEAARALINEPQIILADEPTGNLDRKNGKKIMEIFRGLKDKGQTLIFVTHDHNLAKWGDRVIMLTDGKVVKDVYGYDGDPIC